MPRIATLHPLPSSRRRNDLGAGITTHVVVSRGAIAEPLRQCAETGYAYMSSQAKGLVEVRRSSDETTPSLEDQIAELRSELERVKTQSKSWVKTWGVYLGVLGALIAVPKGALDLAMQLWQRPDTSVEIREVTMYRIPELSPPEIVKFPLVVMNRGNFDDVLLSSGASLTVAGQSVELSDSDFGLFDDGKKIDMSLVVPKNESRLYEVSITFNPKTREVAAAPGPHKLELRFLGDQQHSLRASVCFGLQASEVHDMFQSNDYWHQTMITQCPGRS